MNIFNLVAKIVLDTSDYDKNLDKSSKSINSFASKVSTGVKTAVKGFAAFASAVSVAAGAVAKLTLKAINYGDEIDKNSQKLGLSTKAYQEWSLAAQMAGTDTSTLQTGIRQLTTFTENLSKGQGDALLTLQELGIGYDDFMGMNFDDQLLTIVNAMQGVEDSTDKARLAQQLFGSRAYQELLPLLNQEQGSLQSLFAEMEAGGQIIEDDMIKQSAKLNDELTVLKTTVKTAGTSFLLDFAPAISTVVNGLQDLVTGNEEAIDTISEGIIQLIDDVSNKLPVVIGKVADLLIKVIVGLTEGDTFTKLTSSVVNLAVDLVKTLLNNLPTLVSALFSVLNAAIDALMDADWDGIIESLVETLVDVVILAVENLPKIATKLVELGVKIISAIWTAISNFITGDGLWGLINWFFSFDWAGQLWRLGGIIAQAVINGLISGVESGLNIVVTGINAALDGLSKAWTWMGIPAIDHIPYVYIPRVNWFAEGGMFDDLMKFAKGTMYAVAGENGAEIVAQGARGTGVANVEQIAQAQYSAMEEYGMKEEIRNGVAAIVTAISQIGSGSDRRERNTQNYNRADVLDALLRGVNEALSGQGRRTLNQVTQY